MTHIDEKKQEFVRLIDQALIQSEEMLRQVPARAEQLHVLVSELQRIKAKILNDQLQPSEGTLTLGLARGLADWIEPLNSPLLNAVGAIELFYQRDRA
jgi:hypothetical protein